MARRKAAIRRRNFTIGGIGGAVLLLFFGVILWNATRDDDTTDVTTTPSTTPTSIPSTSSTPPTAAMESAAGKPCLPLADPLPPGAPAVPVKEGPPPAQLVQEDLVVGTGATVNPGDSVTAHYVGVACSTGKIFDSSYSRGAPAEFSLSGVVKGWADGLPGMKVGGQRLLGIPPDLGYGPDGFPPDIAGGETLWFVVEVTATQPAA